jgi:hypothetical protein
LPAGTEIPAWEGVTASQDFKKQGYPNYMLGGGKTQLFIADSQNLIADDLTMHETKLLWEK